MKFEDQTQCTDQPIIGNTPLSYFLLGLLEVIFSTFILIIFFKRNCFPSLSKSKMISFIMPVYLAAVFILLLMGFLFGVDRILGFYPSNIILYIIKWFVIRWFTEGLSIFFLHIGVGTKSVRNSIFFGFLWSFTNCILIISTYYFAERAVFLAMVIFVVSHLFLFYTLLWLLPFELLHRRPAALQYSISNLILLLAQVLSIIVYASSSTTDGEECGIEMVFAVSEFVQLVVILQGFAKDSIFWQGLYENRNVNLNQPLIGIWDMNNRSAVKMVTDSIAQLEQDVVYIIPFGQLRVDTSKYFSGGSARVYRGTYLNNEVAIKILFCIELTPDRILEFCKEASVLNSLQHPNIVKCFGVAIMPPAISLVTEFCIYGSLFDFLYSTDIVYNINRNSGVLSLSGNQRTSDRTLNSKNSRLSQSGTNKDSDNDKQNNENSESFSILANLMEEGQSNKTQERESSVRFSPEVVSNKSSAPESTFSPLNNEDPIESQTQVKSYSKPRKSTLSSEKPIDLRANREMDVQDVAQKLAEAMRYSQMDVSGSVQNSVRESNFSLVLSQNHLVKSSMKGGSFRYPARPREQSISSSGKLKSATSILLTMELGYGMGPNESSHKEQRYNVTRVKTESLAFHDLSSLAPSVFLSSINTSTHSLGNFLPLYVRIRMARDCCAGLAHLHKSRFIHCDIKSLNFLVTSSLTVKLADLGEARPLDSQDEYHSVPRNINWSSPEILTCSSTSSQPIEQSSDIWSLAMVFSEIFSGEIPFDSTECKLLSLEKFVDKLKGGMRPRLPLEVRKLNWLNDLVINCWEYEPHKRLVASSVLLSLENYLNENS